MGCGCGKRKNNRAVIRSMNDNKRRRCSKCGGFMVYKQTYSPRMKRYIKIWECTNKRCKNRITGTN